MNPLRLYVIPQSEMIPNYNLNLQLLPFTNARRPRELLNLIMLPNVDVCNCVMTIRLHHQDYQESVQTDSASASWKSNSKIDPPYYYSMSNNHITVDCVLMQRIINR